MQTFPLQIVAWAHSMYELEKDWIVIIDKSTNKFERYAKKIIS